ncbi:MAG: SDR family oxidoreductase [Gemmatimonadetes bacterium]|nr:MAG: SDR family oxidoreductase [Gemmatimonadota bacterium]
MYKEKFDMTGRVVIVTGGGGLVGREYVAALSEAGAHAVVADLNLDAAQAAAENVPGEKALPLRLDLTDLNSIQQMIDQVMNAYGRIDGLVNNAAIDPKFDRDHQQFHTNSFETFPLELWQQSLDVNLTGMFLCTQAVAPIMIQQKKGVVVNISSTYGMNGPDQRLYQKDDPNEPPTYKPVNYTVTKSAVFGFTKYLAAYWADNGLRVNTLTLGGVFNNHDEEFVRRYSARTTLNRMANKDEYCGALIFLLSDASSYMTGANLVIDGGWSAW